MGLFSLFSGFAIFGKILHENVKEETINQTIESAAKNEAKASAERKAVEEQMSKDMNDMGLQNTELQKKYIWLYVCCSAALRKPTKNLDEFDDPKNQYRLYGLRPTQRYDMAMEAFQSLGYYVDPFVSLPEADIIMKVNIY